MTLLDAPKYDEVRERRNRLLVFGSAGLVLVLLVGWWLVAGRPLDWPWNWNTHMAGAHAPAEAEVAGFAVAPAAGEAGFAAPAAWITSASSPFAAISFTMSHPPTNLPSM